LHLLAVQAVLFDRKQQLKEFDDFTTTPIASRQQILVMADLKSTQSRYFKRGSYV
jgi:hypothetical protein